jgi:hypothetical protein
VGVEQDKGGKWAIKTVKANAKIYRFPLVSLSRFGCFGAFLLLEKGWGKGVKKVRRRILE